MNQNDMNQDSIDEDNIDLDLTKNEDLNIKDLIEIEWNLTH